MTRKRGEIQGFHLQELQQRNTGPSKEYTRRTFLQGNAVEKYKIKGL